jgi:hypothetical protein
MKYTIAILHPDHLASVRDAILKTGRMFAGDDGDAENGPDFWYDCHKLGQLEANMHVEGIVVNNRRRRIYCTEATQEQARQDAAELALVPPTQFRGGDDRMRPNIDPRLGQS